MISLQKKFLFIHVPKTGGNSIQNILKDYSEDRILGHPDPGGNGLLQRFQVRNDRYGSSKHSTLSQYRTALEPEIFRGLYRFSVIRNPWDRMISYYFSPHRGINGWNRYSFLELIREVQPVRHYICCKKTVTPLTIIGNICREFGVQLPLLHRKLAGELDFLIRFEQLDSDFQKVCDRLEIPFTPLPRVNRSRHDHYSSYYDDETREAVRRKFREEIVTGNYSFETVNG